MANESFTASANINNKVPRSVRDMSHQVNLTGKLGAIIPFYCQPVLPGESKRIEPEVGFRFMPMVFPIQTRMKAYVHFFYVRNRSLWSDWMDFIYGTKTNLSMPYISSDSEIDFGNSSLADYLGIPTYLYGNNQQTLNQKIYLTDWYTDGDLTDETEVIAPYIFASLNQGVYSHPLTTSDLASVNTTITGYPAFILEGVKSFGSTIYITYPNAVFVGNYALYECEFNGQGYSIKRQLGSVSVSSQTNNISIEVTEQTITGTLILLQLAASSSATTAVAQNVSIRSLLNSGFHRSNATIQVISQYMSSNGVELKALDPSMNPFLNGNLPLNAMPFRAYEAIYNAYYRNQQNDPFKINGVSEYNKWIPTDAGGADSTKYDLHYRLWEPDMFTTCLPSPQAGDTTPLVGITQSADGKQLAAFSDEDGVIHSVRFKTGSDGYISAEVSTSDEDSYDGKKIYQLADAITTGISINDLRSVNALQRWLELQQRKGYRYRDLTKGHYDVDIKFDELQMPEFLGGFTQDVFVNQVTSTAATETTDSAGNTISAPLGSWAGNAGCVGKMKGFSRYFDEHGYVIGLLCIVPSPVYTQTLPKHFTYMDKFDYYFPEFANIGMQAVGKDLLCPLQWFNQNSDKVKTFGYQRPWYEWCSALDTAHGLFRSSLRNFVMNRVFNGVPSLGHDFLTVDPNQLNDVFVDTDDTDKFLGEIYIKESYKSIVPNVSISKLE